MIWGKPEFCKNLNMQNQWGKKWDFEPSKLFKNDNSDNFERAKKAHFQPSKSTTLKGLFIFGALYDNYYLG